MQGRRGQEEAAEAVKAPCIAPRLDTFVEKSWRENVLKDGGWGMLEVFDRDDYVP